jgi:hypothetical protein
MRTREQRRIEGCVQLGVRLSAVVLFNFSL